jgi:hypothetical protein
MSVERPEKRTTRRWSVGLPAECKLGGVVAPALVRDVTQAGAFIVSGTQPSGLLRAPEPTLEHLLEVGDRILLSFLRTTVMDRRSIWATVRWQGISAEHGSRGYGVRYDTP